MIIKLQIQHQRIRGAKQVPRLVVEKSRRFVKLDLEFDDEWEGLTTTVVFSNDHKGSQSVELLWTGEPLEIPEQVLVTGTMRISCVGVGNNGLYMTTEYMQDGIRIYRSGDVSGLTPGSSVPGLWEQVLATVGSLSALETETKDSIVAAVNEIHGKAIQNIEQTVYAETDGGVNEYTITQVDGTKTVLQVLNGSRGNDGRTPIIGPNGNWFVYNEDTRDFEDSGYYSGGAAPYIGENGNWWIGTEDSGVAASGRPGERGPEGPAGSGIDMEYDEATGTVRIVGAESDEGEVGGETGILTVNVTKTEDTLSADKTYNEIQAAAQAGKLVQARYEGNTYMLGYADPTDTYVDFNHMWGRYLKILEITSENAVRYVVMAFTTE